jgi:hypothetical protein
LLAAGQGHERAMNLVGRCCEEGWGTARDLEAAADWYQRSAEGGYFRGQFNWATLLLKAGRFEDAALWLERAADGGSPGIRDAVIDVLGRATGESALRNLAARLAAQGSSGISHANGSGGSVAATPVVAIAPRAREFP